MLALSPTSNGQRLALYLTGSALLFVIAFPILVQPHLAAVASRIDPTTREVNGVLVTPASPEALAMLEQSRAKSNRSNGDQPLLQRSRQITHGLEKDTGTIHTRIAARTRTTLHIDCRDDDGTLLATMTWDRATGKLAGIYHRSRRERGMGPAPWTASQARTQALYWLRCTGAFPTRGELQVTRQPDHTSAYRFLVRSPGVDARIGIDAVSGELVDAVFSWGSGKPGGRPARRG